MTSFTYYKNHEYIHDNFFEIYSTYSNWFLIQPSHFCHFYWTHKYIGCHYRYCIFGNECRPIPLPTARVITPWTFPALIGSAFQTKPYSIASSSFIETRSLSLLPRHSISFALNSSPVLMILFCKNTYEYTKTFSTLTVSVSGLWWDLFIVPGSVSLPIFSFKDAVDLNWYHQSGFKLEITLKGYQRCRSQRSDLIITLLSFY